ncbi:MAG: hypothetical protein ACRD04_03580 [Terriglobales bacterium]
MQEPSGEILAAAPKLVGRGSGGGVMKGLMQLLHPDVQQTRQTQATRKFGPGDLGRNWP